MNRRWTDLRFARRLLLLFVTSALLPVAAMVGVSWLQVTGQLREQSHERLQRASKAVALTLLGRLQALDRELVTLDPSTALASWRERELRARFSDVAVVPPGGEPWALFGEVPELPALDAEAEKQLAEGQGVMRVDDGDRVLVMRRAPGDGSPAPLLVARTRSEPVFDLSASSVVPPQADFCVLSDRRHLLECSFEHPPPLERLLEAPSSGPFEWRHGGETYIAHAYPLFLAGAFAAPGWTVLLSEPRSVVLAPLSAFHRALPLVALLSIIVVTLLAIRQIRARLAPLEALQEGTRRIAQRDFDVAVKVDSGDEFDELAGSFNVMARRLRGQFRSLSSLVETDRVILEASEEHEVVEALLRRVPEVYPCHAVLVVPIPTEPEATLVAWYLRGGDPTGVRRTPVPVFPEPRAPELPEGGRLVSLASCDLPQLEPLRELGATSAWLLPMVVQGEAMGLAALAHRDEIEEVPEEGVYARRVVDQAAIAIRSIRVHEQNRVLAYYDSLTGLPNRLLFRERLEQALSRSERRPTCMAVCLLDLDGFKRVNDTLGHDAGDRLLQQVAERIFPLLRQGTFARLGGDEFTILLSDLERGEDAARVAERIVEVLSEPFELDGRELFMTASIGLAVHPEDGADAESLLKHADVAMYHVKDRGRNGYQFFSSAMNAAAMHRMELEQAFRQALQNDEVELAYQPLFDAEGRTVVGVEALLRWEHPELGRIPPSVFIPLAEETGLIVPVGGWALEAALAQLARWERDGHELFVSVNLSARQFREEDLAATVRAALRKSGVRRGHLVLELTESMLMSDEREVVRKLTELRMAGAQLAIDDFGTGFSSFAYLKDLPVDVLKLDRLFVTHITESRADATILGAMIGLGHGLGMKVVVEGVEGADQLEVVRSLGGDWVQGFLLGTPVDAAAISDLMRGACRKTQSGSPSGR